MRQDVRNRGPESRRDLVKLLNCQRQRQIRGRVGLFRGQKVGSEWREREAAGAMEQVPEEME